MFLNTFRLFKQPPLTISEPILTGPTGWNILVILYSAFENSLPKEAPHFSLTISAFENSHILEAPPKNGDNFIPHILLLSWFWFKLKDVE